MECEGIRLGGESQDSTGSRSTSAEPARATIFFSNELRIDADGWAMIAPFGDYPSEALLPTPDGKLKRQRAIQRITRDSADTMVAQFHNSRAGLKKFIRGCNIYVGHPDMPGLESRYPDREPKGVFADMEVRERGIYGLPVFTDEGMDLVEGRKLVNGHAVRGFSGRLIEATPDGTRDGLPVFCPRRIASAGLTPFPHLPVEFFNSDDTLTEADPQIAQRIQNGSGQQDAGAENGRSAQVGGTLPCPNPLTRGSSIANSQTEPPSLRHGATGNKQPNTMKDKLLKVCTLLGIQFANDADETQMETALDLVETKITTLQTSLTAERDQARMEFANERSARIADELALAVTSGRITEAERPAWKARLEIAAQFVNEVSTIRTLPPRVKTTSITLTRGQRKDQIDLANPRQRQQFVNEVLTEIAVEQKLDLVRHSKQILNLARERHPALFDLPHVEIKTGKRK